MSADSAHVRRTLEAFILVLTLSFVGGVYAGLLVRAARSHPLALLADDSD